MLGSNEIILMWSMWKKKWDYVCLMFFIFIFQAYAIVGDTIDKMQFVFEEIVRNDANRPALRPKQ